jgi:hypothetical protein
MSHHSSKPKVSAPRHLRPEEAAKLIAAAGNRGRYPERDKLLLRLAYPAYYPPPGYYAPPSYYRPYAGD